MTNPTVNMVQISDGVPTCHHFYDSAGIDQTLQKMITYFLHNRAMECGYTLAQLGYFHMNVASYTEEGEEIKIYFHPSLATITTYKRNGSPEQKVNPVLNIFQNYLFVGDVSNVVTFDTIATPKYRIEEDDMGKPALHLTKLNKKMDDGVEVLVMHCNMNLTLAAIHDVNLFTPKMEYSITTVASTDAKENSIIAIGSRQEYPIKIGFDYAANHEPYDPSMAVPYLMSKYKQNQEAHHNQQKLSKKISAEAKDIKKKKENKSSKFYSKYR